MEDLAHTRHDQLRRLVARHALATVHRSAPIDEELRLALRWPEDELDALKTFLLALRKGLAVDADWRELLHYYNEVATVVQQEAIMRTLLNLDRLIVTTPQGDALRVQLAAQGITRDEYECLGVAYPSLYAYLLAYIARKYAFDARLQEFVRLALESGACAVLLDGLDEVGDAPGGGQLTRR